MGLANALKNCRTRTGPTLGRAPVRAAARPAASRPGGAWLAAALAPASRASTSTAPPAWYKRTARAEEGGAGRSRRVAMEVNRIFSAEQIVVKPELPGIA